MTDFYSKVLMSLSVFLAVTISGKADSVRKLQYETYYGDWEKGVSDEATRKVQHLYDASNRPLCNVETSLNGEEWPTTHYYRYIYDANGNLIKEKTLTYGLFDYGSWGYQESADSVTYEYNDKNQCVWEIHQLTKYNYTYDEAGHKLTSSKYSANTITREWKTTADLVETFSDFNSFGDPCTITATSPSGKTWNEYTGTITYDAAGHKTSEIHIDMDGVMTMHETWTYDGDMLTEHVSYNVLDGQDNGWTKESFAIVDGNPDKVKRTVIGSDGAEMGGQECLLEYAEMDGEKYAPTLTVEVSEDDINTACISFICPEASQTGDFTLFRNGEEIATKEDMQLSGDRYIYTDKNVRNGNYDYVVSSEHNASNVASARLYIELPCATDLYFVSKKKNLNDENLVTIGWTNPEYSEVLQYQNTCLFFENDQTAEASTTDASVTQLEANFGPETVKTLYVQTNYLFGHANSATVEIDINNTSDIKTVDSEQSAVNNRDMFNIAGQRITTAKKGIYIKNGKKVSK